MTDPTTPEGNAARRRELYLDGFVAGVGNGAGVDAIDDSDWLAGFWLGNFQRNAALDGAPGAEVMRAPGAYYTPPAVAARLISELDGVSVYHGDALRVLPELPTHSVDVFLCDPPYSSGGMFRGDRTGSTSSKYVQTGQTLQFGEFSGDTRDQRAYLTWCTMWISEALRVCKPAGLMCIFTDWRQIGVTIDALQCGGFIYRGIVPWNKTEAARPRKGAFRNQCEYVVWGSNGAMLDAGPCHPGVFTASVAGSEKHHIAGKPETLMQELVKICPPGGTVCDLFGGSGTTAKAAKLMGRKAIVAEIAREWVDVILDRTREPVLIPPEEPASQKQTTLDLPE